MQYILLISFLVFLGGCDSVKSTLGLGHDQPDEFLVPTNPPLELPPNYNLRPPRAGQDSHVNNIDSSESAKKALGVETKQKSAAVTSQDNTTSSDIAKQAEQTAAIRETVNKEAGVEGSVPADLKEELTKS
jgi:hypothetical protein